MWMGWIKQAFGGPAMVAPLTINFLPSWWYGQYGISHGERIFRDPDFRAETQRDMHRLIFERFGQIGFGQENPSLVYTSDHLGNANMPAMLGCEVTFSDDQYPLSSPLSMEQLQTLQAPTDVTKCFPLCELLEQEKYIAKKTGRSVGLTWPFQGVQNIAMFLRGSDLLMGYYVETDLTKRLLDVSCDLILSMLALHNTRGQEVLFSHQNCTADLCGPKVYEQFLFEYETKLYRAVQELGWKYNIHHCGLFDAFAGLYRRLGTLDSIQIGWGSDVRLALETFPEAKIDYILSPTFVQNTDVRSITDRVRALVEEAGAEIGRFSLTVCDIENGVPDEKIVAVAEGLFTGDVQPKPHTTNCCP